MMTSKVRRKKRKILAERDGKQCCLCGDNFAKNEIPTLDHRIPKSKGGTNHINNLQLAHKTCNERKGDKMPP